MSLIFYKGCESPKSSGETYEPKCSQNLFSLTPCLEGKVSRKLSVLTWYQYCINDDIFHVFINIFLCRVKTTGTQYNVLSECWVQGYCWIQWLTVGFSESVGFSSASSSSFLAKSMEQTFLVYSRELKGYIRAIQKHKIGSRNFYRRKGRWWGCLFQLFLAASEIFDMIVPWDLDQMTSKKGQWSGCWPSSMRRQGEWAAKVTAPVRAHLPWI